jgi:hypothetical protein
MMRCEYSPDECEPTPQVRLFLNVMGEGSNWLQLDLEGAPGTNRSAIGARVEVAAAGTTQTQYVDGGHGFFGQQRDMVLHFGLGESCVADVLVTWPDAGLSTQELTVHANARYHVLQGEDPEPVR